MQGSDDGRYDEWEEEEGYTRGHRTGRRGGHGRRLPPEADLKFAPRGEWPRTWQLVRPPNPVQQVMPVFQETMQS